MSDSVSPQTEEYEVLPNKYAIPGYLEGRLHGAVDLDMIDVTGVVVASEEWTRLLSMCEISGGTWRCLLLDEQSVGAVRRAQESDVWQGNVERLARQAAENRERLMAVAASHSCSVEVRLTSGTPVSRYLRVSRFVFQSYYPSNSTGRFVPVVVLPARSVLAERAAKEFEVLWEDSPIYVLDGLTLPNSPIASGNRAAAPRDMGAEHLAPPA